MLESGSIASPEVEPAITPATLEGSTPIGRSLLHGTLVYGATNFGLRAFNFGLVILYTRFLTPADFGTVALAEVIAAVVGAISSLGLSSAIQPLYFGYLDKPTILRRCISTLLRFGAAATFGIIVISFFLGALLPSTPGLHVAFFPYIAIALGTAGALQLVDYRLVLYQTEERPVSYAMLAVACFVFTAGATVYLVVVVRHGALGLLSGKLAGAVLTLLLASWLCRKWLRGGWNSSFVWEAIPIALPLVPHLLLALGLVAADRLILQRYRSLEEVGLYSLAYTFGMVMFLVTASVAKAWSPVFYRLASQGAASRPMIGRMLSAIVLSLAAVAVFGATIADPVIRTFLDERYWRAARLVPWVIGGYLFHAVFAMFQLSVLHARKAQFIWVISMIALATNIGLNFAWVPRRGMYGAAYATTIAYAIEAFLMYIYAQRVFELPFKMWKTLLAIAIFGVVLTMTQVRFSTTVRIEGTVAICILCLGIMYWLGRAEWILLKDLSDDAERSGGC
jgi:O-antigen/teichoic acid export membrane protein